MDKKKFDLIADKLNEAINLTEECDGAGMVVFIGQKVDEGIHYMSSAQGRGDALVAIIMDCLIDEPNLLMIVEAAVKEAKKEVQQN